jgi:hypothetical protein
MIRSRLGLFASYLSLLCTVAFLVGAARGSVAILSMAAVLTLVCIGLNVFIIRGKMKARRMPTRE